LCQNIKHLKPFKSFLIVHGLIEDKLMLGEFIKSCFTLGEPDIALSTFRTIKNPSGSLQNMMVRGLSSFNLYEDILYVYMKCRVLNCPSDDFTFPFVIKACASLGAFGAGKEIHCVVLRTGFDRNIVIQTSLVDFYAKNGRTEIARKLVDRIPQPDLVSWNALIAGYSLNGLDVEAFELFREIRLMGFMPNLSTMANVIPVCTSLGCSDTGKCLHGLAIKFRFWSSDFLVPALISMYVGDEDLSTARRLFDSVVEKNVIVWNSMMSAYTQKQKSFEAYELFKRMLQDDIKPDVISFVSILPSCENLSGIWYGESLHACVIKQGSESQVSVLTAFVSMYAKLGYVNSAECLFSRMRSRNLLSWNALVSGYVYNGLWDASLAAFCKMQYAGFDPDSVSIVSLLSVCSKLGAALIGKSAHAFCVRKGIDSNLNVSNALLAFYSDCHQLSASVNLFHKMATRNNISWNTILSGYVRSGEVNNAAALFYQMHKDDVMLDVVTMISVLPIYNKKEDLGKGMTIHGYSIKKGIVRDVSLVNALISMYCYCGNLDAGRLLLESMPERNLASWNALMTGYRCHKLQNEVFFLFGQMTKEVQRPNHITLLNILPLCYTLLQGISLWNAIMSVHVRTKNAKRAVFTFCELLNTGYKPDYMTVLSLISACVEVNSPGLTRSVMAYVICQGFGKNIIISNALIDLNARCGNILTAKRLFDDLLEKDPVSWSVLINGYRLHGDGQAALDLFQQMQLSGVRPDDVTYLSVLSACSHAGLVEQGWIIFKSIKENGISPKMEHYACMVDLLGRTGYLDEADDIVKKLPGKPSASLLESLLGACRTYGNVELGEKIGDMLIEIDPENSGSYVMLYNIYAAAERWTDADRVRSNIEGKRLRKEPGYSLLV
ncbi:PPR domain-containing protein/PPR_2 domain-containing protein, partial [Cephalotus follicularis]